MGRSRDLLRGGKRLRPAFCYWGWRGAGGADGDRDRDGGRRRWSCSRPRALIHDDVMDGCDTRRGQPAAHRRFAALHRGRLARRRRGVRRGRRDPAGDLCLSGPTSCSPAPGLPAEALLRGRAVFDRMRTELMGGQYLDVLEQAAAERRPVERAPRR